MALGRVGVADPALTHWAKLWHAYGTSEQAADWNLTLTGPEHAPER